MPKKFVSGRVVAACRRNSPFPVPTSISTEFALPNNETQSMGSGVEWGVGSGEWGDETPSSLPTPSVPRFAGEGGTDHTHGASCSLERRRGLRTAQALQ